MVRTIVFGTTIVWLIVTYITKPVEEKKLVEFYERTYPGGIGWKHIQKLVTGKNDKVGFWKLLINWIMGVVLIYSFLFGIGKIIFAEYLTGISLLLAGIVAGSVIYFNLNKKENNVEA